MAKQPIRRRSSVKDLGPRNRSSIFAGAVAIFLLTFIIAIRLLGDRLYDFPSNPELASLPKNTAIICLAGGKGRIETAFDLFFQDVGDSLFIIGAGKKSTINSLLRNHASPREVQTNEHRLGRIIVENESRNTIENAFAVSRYLQQNPNIKTVLLVTSGYHMRRAQFMIENQVHREIKIIPYNPPKEVIEQQTWWHTWLGIQVTVVEYGKFLLATLLIPRLGYF